MLKNALLVMTGIVIGAGAITALYAQSSAPYYEVAAITVTDKTAYEASGVVQVRDAIKAVGGKVIAGGYNKTETYAGSAAPNRYIITLFPSKEVHDKFWTEHGKPWADKVEGKSASVNVIGVEAVEQK